MKPSQGTASEWANKCLHNRLPVARERSAMEATRVRRAQERKVESATDVQRRRRKKHRGKREGMHHKRRNKPHGEQMIDRIVGHSLHPLGERAL